MTAGRYLDLKKKWTDFKLYLQLQHQTIYLQRRVFAIYEETLSTCISRTGLHLLFQMPPLGSTLALVQNKGTLAFTYPDLSVVLMTAK